MCSWCIIALPLHGKVCRVFDGLGVRLMLHVHVTLSLLLWHASYVCPFVNTFPCMRSLFISFVIAPCLINVPISALTHDEMTSNPKIS